MGNNLKKKSIVYLTVNLINFKIYVGVHDIDPDNPWDGYLGNGINRFRPSTIKHPKEPFHFAVKKYGFDAFRRFTIATFDTRQEALRLEGIIVNEEFVAREDTYNVALGGGDPPKNNKTVYRYSLDGEFIKQYNSMLEAADECGTQVNCIGNAIEFKIRSADCFWTEYYVEKLDVSNFLNTTQVKKVYAYDSNGNFKLEFDSINDCAKHFEVNLGPVQRAIKGQTKIKNHYISFEKLKTFSKKITQKHYGDPIHQYSLTGDYIKTFNSIGEVVKQLGKTYQGIPNAIKLGATCGNYQWSWELLPKMPNKEKNVSKSRKVGQYTLDGKLVKVYDTVRECRKYFGNVGKVLKGQANSAKGYTFKYMD